MTKTQSYYCKQSFSFYCKYVPALRLASTLIAIYISGMTIAEQTYQSQSLIQVITIILMILVFLYFAVIKKKPKRKNASLWKQNSGINLIKRDRNNHRRRIFSS